MSDSPSTAGDPFEVLAHPAGAQTPRPSFARTLRARLVAELGLDDTTPTVPLPERKTTMTTTVAPVATAVTPYLSAHDAVAALDWYTSAFGAVEQFRVVGDDGRLGHAEFTIGDARFMLSDEYPEIGVNGPTTLGGASVTLHLEVTDVDAQFARAVDAGATALQEPADQPHGARHGTLADPYGHRWMLSQPTESIDLATYAERSRGSGYEVRRPEPSNGIWAVVSYRDVHAGIRFVTDVLGFEEWVLVTDDQDPSTVVHSEYRWPEGGVVQLAGHEDDHAFLPPPGVQSLYVVTADPWAVWERCRAAGVEVLREPESPHYDPDGMGFSIRDAEGNSWSFGTYAGGSTG